MGQTLRCPACGERLGNTNAAGDKTYRVRGVQLKKDGSIVLFCKHCHAPFSNKPARGKGNRSPVVIRRDRSTVT